MKTTNNKASGRLSRALGMALALGLSLTLLATTAAANTGAGSVILNVAQIDYKDASGTNSFQANSAVSVTVSLVAAAPTITAPADQAVASGSTATYTYTVTANANGSDTYPVAAAVSASSGLTSSSATPSVATVTLGASVIIAQPAGDQIVIPAGSGANLSGGDIVVVGGVDYEISSISLSNIATNPNDSDTLPGAASTLAATTAETPITITLIANAAGSNSDPAFNGSDVGTVVGEQQSFTVDVTGVVSGTSNGTATVDTTVGTVAATDQTVTTFQASALTIEKMVGPVGGPYATTGAGVPGATLEYRITITNSGSANATSVSLTDPVPPYTSYVANSTRLNGITVAGDGAASPLAGGLAVDDDGARLPAAVASGVIGGPSSAVVTFQVTIN